MAFQSTISRCSKRTHQGMLDRFLSLQIQDIPSNPTSSSSSSSSSSSPPTSTSSALQIQTVHPKQLRNQSNPFRPFKNPTTNRWWSSKISARREAQLIDIALRSNSLDLIVSNSKKLQKLKERLQVEETSFSSLTSGNSSSNSSILPPLTLQDEAWFLNRDPFLLSPMSGVQSMRKSESGKKDHLQVRKEAKLEQYRIVRRLISKKGPYKGRKSIRMFKGTKDERDHEKRWSGIQKSLDGMENKVQDWRMVSREERVKDDQDDEDEGRSLASKV